MGYYDFKENQKKELNKFKGIFYAFNKEQFVEGMGEVGLKENETDKISRLGNNGGFILKNKIKDFVNLIDMQALELAKKMKSYSFAYDTFYYELANHEYCISYNDEEVLGAIGYTTNKILENNTLAKAYKNAKNDYLANAESCWGK